MVIRGEHFDFLLTFLLYGFSFKYIHVSKDSWGRESFCPFNSSLPDPSDL